MYDDTDDCMDPRAIRRIWAAEQQIDHLRALAADLNFLLNRIVQDVDLPVSLKIAVDEALRRTGGRR